MQRSRRAQLIGLVGWLLVSFAAAAIGAFATVNAGAFYGALLRPAWAPPAWLFGPVWTALYAAMGIAAWLVWRSAASTATRGALGLFLIQLIVNGLWSWLFFAWRLGGVALAEIGLLWLLIVATIVAFWRFKPLAAWLLVPYLVWVSFAAALNWSLWTANPELLSGIAAAASGSDVAPEGPIATREVATRSPPPALPQPPADETLAGLRAMSETFRNTTLLIAIREAGFVCDEVIDAYEGTDDTAAWRATCRDMRAYFVRVAVSGTLIVEPTIAYFDAIPPRLVPFDRQPDPDPTTPFEQLERLR
jgi:tryptophan-rich sensory protein